MKIFSDTEPTSPAREYDYEELINGVFGKIEWIQLGVPPEHKGIIRNSIRETLTHLSVEDKASRGFLKMAGESMDDTFESILGFLTSPKRPIVVDQEGRIVNTPIVKSLELSRRHHMLSYQPDEEDVMRSEVGGFIESIGMKTLGQQLHKVTVKNIFRGDEHKVTGAIVSIKRDIATTADNRVMIRHRGKYYLNVAELEARPASNSDLNGSSGSIQELFDNEEEANYQIDPSKEGATSMLDYLSKHNEYLLTSIYYAFRTDRWQEGENRDRQVLIGEKALIGS
ncbi:hypothetical protein EOM60_03850 [Candidatus Saccharibacteria bacterium]|nr:hypothetical protein [Candidatus Saccharibacteria bacterium]